MEKSEQECFRMYRLHQPFFPAVVSKHGKSFRIEMYQKLADSKNLDRPGKLLSIIRFNSPFEENRELIPC